MKKLKVRVARSRGAEAIDARRSPVDKFDERTLDDFRAALTHGLSMNLQDALDVELDREE